MTPTTTAVVSVATGTSVAGLMVAEAAAIEPWWIAVLVLPLAGFAGYLVRWNLNRQQEADKAAAAREAKREEREEKRAEQDELQTRAMLECVVELRRLNEQQEEHGRALAAVPQRLAEMLEKRRTA